ADNRRLYPPVHRQFTHTVFCTVAQGGTELRLKLVWLCWLDLMTGNSLEDWKENLKRKSEKELEEWIINRQRQSAALTDLMDQYVLLAYRTTVDDNRN
ncbi:hypothetical protein QU795_24270, partial [Escherichia coli]|nr:hypothetical protein [Escherichia coli]